MAESHGYQDQFMIAALEEAKKALACSEVPVGCVFVDPTTNQIITRGHNLTNLRKNALEHAELVAIGKYSDEITTTIIPNFSEDDRKGESNKIENSHLYVTVEPCIMCAAALLFHGVSKVFFGCRNPRFGGNGTILSVHDDASSGSLWEKKKTGNLGYESFSGYREEEAIKLLQGFYEQENPSAPEPKLKTRRRRENEDGKDEK